MENTEKIQVRCDDRLINVSKFFVVAINSEEDWEQLSVGLSTYEQACVFLNSEHTKHSHPYAFIVCTINKNL